MKKSQISVLSAFAFIVLLMFVAAVSGRIILSRVGATSIDQAEAASSRNTELVLDELVGFGSVDVRGTWQVTLVRGSNWDVELVYPEDLEDPVDVRVEDGRLILGNGGRDERWWRGFGGGRGRFAANIVMPMLAGIEVSGASAVLEFMGFDGDTLAISISGAAAITGRDGHYDRLSLDVSGASAVNLRDVSVDDAEVNLAGASEVNLRMNGGVLSGSLSGVGGINYHGSVSEERVSVSGFGKVSRVD